jgi:hypothetical protein
MLVCGSACASVAPSVEVENCSQVTDSSCARNVDDVTEFTDIGYKSGHSWHICLIVTTW